MRWKDISPEIHPFDGDAAPDRIRRIVSDVAKDHDKSRSDVEKYLTDRLIQEFGSWIRGWNWSILDGGPVRYSGGRLREQSVVEAVADWRSFTEELLECFCKIGKLAPDQAMDVSMELAASFLLPVALKRNEGEEYWHETLTAAITWYLEWSGVEPEGLSQAISKVVCGRFHSWSGPEPEDKQTLVLAGKELGEAVAAHIADFAPIDVLTGWALVRRRPTALAERSRPFFVDADSHRAYIETHDRAREPQRAERMLKALTFVRGLALRGERLSFDHLAEAQSIVLGRSVGFRDVAARAKEGRETYSFGPNTASEFSRCLFEAGASEAPLAFRTARVYLDVNFFHPFPDGNARSARLAVDYVLTKAKFGLLAAEPIFKTRQAYHENCLDNLAAAFDEVIAPLDPKLAADWR